MNRKAKVKGIIFGVLSLYILQILASILFLVLRIMEFMPTDVSVIVCLFQITIFLTALLLSQTLKAPCERTFKFKKINLRQLGGSVLVFMGSWLLKPALPLILGFFIPNLNQNYDQSMSKIAESSFIIVFFTLTVLPAICEEFFFRGYVQSVCSAIKTTWVKVGFVGLLFAIFHMDLYQGSGVLPLGIALSYVMLKTQALWLPMLFHFLNNLYPYIIMYSGSGLSNSAAKTEKPTYMYIIMFVFAVPLLYFGCKILNKQTPELNDNTGDADEN